MEPEVRKAPVRFYEIDLLRFIAAVSVMLFHYTFRGYAADNYSPIPNTTLGAVTKYGYLGVQLFFIISGYVVLLSAQGKTVRQFFLSRVTRLYPAFWAACTITFIVKKIWGTGGIDVTMSPLLAASWQQYAMNMTMLQELVGVVPMDGAYWSLLIEISFYFLVSLLIGYRLMHRLDAFIAAWLVMAALPGALQTGTALGALLILSYAPFFAAGMLFFLLQQPGGRTKNRYAMLLLAYLLSIRSALSGVPLAASYYHTEFSHIVAMGLVTSFFLVFLLITFRLINLRRHAWLAWLGALTYPLYLLHSDIGFVAFHRLYGRLDSGLLIAMLFVAMLLAAYLVHVFVEKQLSRILKQKLQVWLNDSDN